MYLVSLFEDCSNPAILLRGAASHSRATLQVHQERQLLVVLGGLTWLSWRYQATYTPGKQPQSALIRLAVIEGDIEEQLSHPKPAWITPPVISDIFP